MMLQTLTVKNFALIEDITVEFGEGLNILTGETGAGKSILIDALGAALGNRVGVNRIRKGADNLSVTATFTSGLIIERHVSRSEKNSITIDGKPATLARLKKICSSLVDIHGQNKNLDLLREEKIYALIDDENISCELEEFGRLYRSLTSQSHALKEKIKTREESLQRLDFLRWQEREISTAQLKPDEDTELNAEIRKLSHAEKITEHIQESAQILNDGDFDVLTALARVAKNLDDVARYDDKLNSARKLLEDAEISLREVYDDIHDYGEGLDFSPERLDSLQTRADEIFKLKKYGATANEILRRLEEIRGEILAAENFDSDVEELRRTTAELERQTKSYATKLLQLRQASAKTLSVTIEREIRRLGMERAQFEIVVSPAEKLSSHGGDTADIIFSANVGEEKLPLSKIVSGGELSRIALAIKTVTACRENSAATLIFDEIDAGIGGVTARTVAEAISKISRGRQVLCITHLPQIASMADVHLRITKSEVGARTITNVTRLNEEECVREIARMASGEESLASMKNAREMLLSAQNLKQSAIKF